MIQRMMRRRGGGGLGFLYRALEIIGPIKLDRSEYRKQPNQILISALRWSVVLCTDAQIFLIQESISWAAVRVKSRQSVPHNHIILRALEEVALSAHQASITKGYYVNFDIHRGQKD